MNEKTIHELANKRKLLRTEKHIDKNTVVIIDFFNVYCYLINFNKYKTFSKETFYICFNRIIDRFKEYKAVYIISKCIFEVPYEYILQLIKPYTNIVYVLVEDCHPIKGANRERDDFACILFNKLKKNSVILTNDKFTNLEYILKNIKPIVLVVSEGNVKVDIDSETLTNSVIPELKLHSVKRIGFSII